MPRRMYYKSLQSCFFPAKLLSFGDFPGCPVVRTSPSNAGGGGRVCRFGPWWGFQVPHTSWLKNQNMKRKKYCNKFNEDFNNGPHQKKKKIFKKANTNQTWVETVMHGKQHCCSAVHSSTCRELLLQAAAAGSCRHRSPSHPGSTAMACRDTATV